MLISKKIGYFTGYSTSNLHEAVQNALEKAGEHKRFEVVESCSIKAPENERQFEVTLSTFHD